MSDFAKNAIIVFIAALLAFLFGMAADFVRRWVADRASKQTLVKNLLLEFETLQKQLDSLKSIYQMQSLFWYMTLDQVDKIVSTIDSLKKDTALLKNDDMQQDVFVLITRVSMLSTNMRSAQRFEDSTKAEADREDVEPSSGSLNFIQQKKIQAMADLQECNRLTEALLRDLRKR